MKRALAILTPFLLAVLAWAANDIVLGTLQPGASGPSWRLQGTNYVAEWGTTAPVSMPTGLVAHWKMNDNAANKTVDDFVGGYDGTASKTNTDAMSVAGKIGEALYFSGAGDYISTPYPGVPGAGARTISVWLLYNGAWDNEFPWSYGKPATARDNFECFYQGTNVHVHVTWGDYYGTTLVSTNEWHHLAVTYDGTTIRSYINTALDKATKVALVTVTNATALFMIGWSSYDGTWGQDWVGAIDDVRFYNRALTTNEIALIYNGGAGTED